MLITTVAALALSAAQNPQTLSSVDVYGLRAVPESAVRAAIALRAGDQRPASRAPIRERLRAIPGVADADVTVVCCSENGGTMLYAGIREAAVEPLSFRAPPNGSVRLPSEVMALGRRFEAALSAAVRGGNAREDDSEGYSLSLDSRLRAVQLEFLETARTRFEELARVLRGARDRNHRALAAQIIGYGSDRQAVVRVLLAAVSDPDDGVRNNATRALAILAQWGAAHPNAGIAIPAEPFIALLNSLSWTDRNKGLLVLLNLSADNPPVLDALRRDALPSLVEMARWTNPGHALGAYLIVSRLAAMDEGAAFQAFERGERESVISRALDSR